MAKPITVSTSTVVGRVTDSGPMPVVGGQSFVVVEGMEPFHALTPDQADTLAVKLMKAARQARERGGAR